MARGDKSKYTEKQKRQAEHIEEGVRKQRQVRRGSRTPRLGDGQRHDAWRQKTRWLRSGQDSQQNACKERWQVGWRRFSCSLQSRAFGLRKEGGASAQTKRGSLGFSHATTIYLEG